MKQPTKEHDTSNHQGQPSSSSSRRRPWRLPVPEVVYRSPLSPSFLLERKQSQKPMHIVRVLLALILLICLSNIYVGSVHIHRTDQSSSIQHDDNGDVHHHHNKGPRALQGVDKNQTVYFAGLGERPPLHAVVDGRNVIGNVSWLLDFAIVGFPKCGTTSIMRHLESHPAVAIHQDERCDLSYNNQGYLARALYKDFSHDTPLQRGLKCPLDLENNILAMPNYRKYFPNTRFIVGVRHPVLWFESFYNFRVHNKFPMPPAEKLTGRCGKGMFNVCAFRSQYHVFLANLGKTTLNSTAERQLFGKHGRLVKPTVTPAPIFLYEVTQLSDTDPIRENRFLNDLQNFLDLEQPLDRMLWFKPGMQHANEAVMRYIEAKKMDICESRYDELRNILMQHGQRAKTWMTDYFMKSPDVTVSSPEHFVNHVMAAWEVDPCIARRNASAVMG